MKIKRQYGPENSRYGARKVPVRDEGNALLAFPKPLLAFSKALLAFLQTLGAKNYKILGNKLLHTTRTSRCRRKKMPVRPQGVRLQSERNGPPRNGGAAALRPCNAASGVLLRPFARLFRRAPPPVAVTRANVAAHGAVALRPSADGKALQR